MAKTIDLLANAIEVYNVDRYSDQPKIAARFENLKGEDIVVTNATVDGDGKTTFSVSSPRNNWSGVDQTYLRAKLSGPKIITTEAKVLDGVTNEATFLEEIKKIEDAGVYRVAHWNGTAGATLVLVIHEPIPANTPAGDVDTATEAAVLAALDAKMLFDFEEDRTTTYAANTLLVTDAYLSDTIYHAPVGFDDLVIDPTDYGALDSDTYVANL